MSKAYRIAYRIKCQTQLMRNAFEIQMSPDVLEILKDNPNPYDPPDLTDQEVPHFCGIPINVRNDWSFDMVAIVVMIPKI